MVIDIERQKCVFVWHLVNEHVNLTNQQTTKVVCFDNCYSLEICVTSYVYMDKLTQVIWQDMTLRHSTNFEKYTKNSNGTARSAMSHTLSDTTWLQNSSVCAS